MRSRPLANPRLKGLVQILSFILLVSHSYSEPSPEPVPKAGPNPGPKPDPQKKPSQQVASSGTSQAPSVVVLYSRGNRIQAATPYNPKLDAVDIDAAPAVPAIGVPPQPRPVALSPKPRCAGDQPFCLFDQEYPLEQVHQVINTYHEDMHNLYRELNRYSLQDMISKDNSSHGYRHRGNFACESEVAYLRPGWARNWRDQWMAVVNTDKYPQSVRIETCKFPNRPCDFLAPCYSSQCVQRFAATRLIVVDPANPHQRPAVDLFDMPAACSCFVHTFRYH